MSLLKSPGIRAIVPCGVVLLSPAHGKASDLGKVEERRVDERGVKWSFDEWADEIDDQRTVLAMAWVMGSAGTRGAVFGFLCVQNLGFKIRVSHPSWNFPSEKEEQLQFRVGRAPAVQVSALAEVTVPDAMYVPYQRGGQAVLAAFRSARDRFVFRDTAGRTATIPLTGDKPEFDRAVRRCVEFAHRALHQTWPQDDVGSR